ncbi:Zeaxanthin epoxidase, chloroplastic [Dendrobium catenatum]|uniref:Zeaxanthin epoxidase, chloroplastic n=1 Tax=Dendrobium catenatum TaxID=906689 RepID=A0A2I0W7Y4_9ASPA|nr:Zeaxanthin epoxidase, chloroplastic [Dendrobium catenatum]
MSHSEMTNHLKIMSYQKLRDELLNTHLNRKAKKEMKAAEETHDIVIIGGGICGLATALALHRKGIKSLVLERSDELRTTGGAISVYMNGWHALDQLGVGEELRSKAILIKEKAGLRCLKRSDLVETLAATLPAESIRFSCRIVATEIDPVTSFPIIHASDGLIIKAKILVGCDGSNSVVAKKLGLKAPKISPICEARGFTNYPNGHSFGDQFLRLWGHNFLLGRAPINDKLVFWFVDHKFNQRDIEAREDPKLIRDLTSQRLEGSPEEVIDMIKNCEINSLTLTRIRYRAPWHILFGKMQKGTTTLAGDSFHVMDPSIGQGGSAAIEDAVVLARCLAGELQHHQVADSGELKKRAEAAIAKYVRERMLRIMSLSTRAFLIGSMSATSSWIKRVIFCVLLVLLSGNNSLSHAQFDCGHL